MTDIVNENADDRTQPIGSTIDGLGVHATLDENQHITEVLVLAKISDFEDGSTSVGIYNSAGMDWVAQLGLFRAAMLVLETAAFSHSIPDEDDE